MNEVMKPEELLFIKGTIAAAERQIKEKLGIVVTLVPDGLNEMIDRYTNSIDKLKYAIVNHTGYIWEKFQSSSRKRELVLGKKAFAWWLYKQIGGYSLNQIASKLNYADHTTVIHSLQTYSNLLAANDSAALAIHDYITRQLATDHEPEVPTEAAA